MAIFSSNRIVSSAVAIALAAVCDPQQWWLAPNFPGGQRARRLTIDFLPGRIDPAWHT